MKKLKSALVCSFSLLIIFCSLVAFFPTREVSFAETQNYSLVGSDFATLDENLEHYGLVKANVNDATPYQSSSGLILGGKSILPTLETVGDTSSFELNISNEIEDYDILTIDTNQIYLNFWVYFGCLDDEIGGLNISLMDEYGTNKVVWELNKSTLFNLLSRVGFSDYDVKAFGSEALVPIGWCEFKLPIIAGTKTGTIDNGTNFVFTKLKIEQTGSSYQSNFLYYDFSFGVSPTLTVVSTNVLDFVNIKLKSGNFIDSTQTYYSGELFPKFSAIKDVFQTCYVGNEDLLKTHTNFVIKVIDQGGNSSDYSYGSKTFVLNSPEYYINYGFNYNNRFVGVVFGRIQVSSYGKGAWIESATNKIEIGSTYKLYYKTHKAFSGASITFGSSDEEVLKIVEVDRINGYIVVEALKSGSSKIVISVNDDRLIGTQFEENGLINNDFQITVVKPSSKLNTTIVMLCIALGILVVTAVVFIVKKINDGRHLDIK